VSYDWSWGDGNSNTTQAPGIQHTFDDAGVFLVRLSVRDDLGQRSEATTIVTVSSGLSPSFFSSPTSPQVGATVFFDASASSSQSGSAIASYTWSFGDGTADVTTTDPVTTKAGGYGATGTYTVRLTITDGEGRTASTTGTVTVVP
jgi:PKD repeat protein